MYDREVACYKDPAQKIARQTGYKQQKFVHFVRDAVYSVAHALHDMFVDKCGENHRGMCEGLKHIDGQTLSTYLANVSFKGSPFRYQISRSTLLPPLPLPRIFHFALH